MLFDRLAVPYELLGYAAEFSSSIIAPLASFVHPKERAVYSHAQIPVVITNDDTLKLFPKICPMAYGQNRSSHTRGGLRGIFQAARHTRMAGHGLGVKGDQAMKATISGAGMLVTMCLLFLESMSIGFATESASKPLIDFSDASGGQAMDFCERRCHGGSQKAASGSPMTRHWFSTAASRWKTEVALRLFARGLAT